MRQCILSLENIYLVGKNKKYVKSKSTGGLILSKEMRSFKELLKYSVKPSRIKPPQRIDIEIEGPHDIDAVLESVIDACKKAFLNKDDCRIDELHVYRKRTKRGGAGSIVAYASTIDEGMMKDGRESDGIGITDSTA